MINKFLLCTSFLCVLFSGLTSAQIGIPANKSHVKVIVRSTVSLLDTSYRYGYIITNDLTSPERLKELDVEVGDVGVGAGGSITNFSDTTSKNWIGWVDIVQAQPSDPTAKGIVIFGVGDTTSSVDDLYSAPLSSLSAGESITASFESKELPSIKRFWGTGWLSPITEETHDSLIALGYTDQDILLPWYSAGTQGTTIAPVLPPSPLNKQGLLDTIESYINQSQPLGWISNHDTAKYLAFMDSAKAQLNRSDTRGAWVTLDSATLNAQRDSGSALTSEGYALIFFNTKYLMAQIPAPPSQFMLTVVVTPSNGGTVTINPNQTQFDSATSVTVTANASNNYHFGHWTGNLTGATNPVTFVMNSNKNDTANFTPTFIITASTGFGGSTSPNGNDTVNYGANQRFTFSSDTGYHVDSVIVDGLKKDSAVGYTFTNITSNHTIRVTFAINMYTITASAGPHGSISPSGSIQVPYNSTPSFTLSADNGYEVDSLIVDNQPKTVISPFTFDPVDSNRSIRVTFISLTDTVTQYLTKYWNLVSVAARVSNFGVGTLFPNLPQAHAYYYSGGYWVTSTLDNRLGYWIYYGNNDSTRINYIGARLDTIHLRVTPGWNLIGSISRVIPYTKLDTGVHATDSLTHPLFKYVNGTGYVPTDTITPGYGYWLHVFKTRPETLVVNGTGSIAPGYDMENPPTPPGAPGRIALYAPYNTSTGQPIVPSPAWYTDEVANSYTIQLATNLDFSPLTWQTTLNQQYPVPLTLSVQVGPLAYGTVYYWRVSGSNQSGTGPWSLIWWFKTQDAPPPPPPCQCCVQSVMQLDGFTVKDASGNGQQMYTLNGGRKTVLAAGYYDMPPAPKPGIFHARFQSGKFVQTVQPGKTKVKIPISVTDAVYPLTLIWSINPDNKMQYWVTQVVNGKQQNTQLSGSSGSITLDAPSVKGGSVIIIAQGSQPPPCGQQ